MTERIYCARQIGLAGKFITKDGIDRCSKCLPDFVAEKNLDFIPNKQCVGYVHHIAVKLSRTFYVNK